MKRLVLRGLAILSLAGAALAIATPTLADGDHYRGDRGGYYGDGRGSDWRGGDHWRGDGWGVRYHGEGDREHREWRGRYWGRGYGGGTCVVRRRVWDPYDGRYELRVTPSACGRWFR